MWDDHTQVAAEQCLCAGYVVVEKGGSFSLTLTQKRAFVYIKDNRTMHAALRTRVFGTIGGSVRVGCVYIVRASPFAARVAVSCLMVPYAKPLPQRDDDDGRPAARARGACSPRQRPPRPRAFRCCTMCSRWDGACATGSSSHRRRAVRATLFAFPLPARLELTAQRSRRRRYAPLHTLAYPECAEHLPVILVYSGRLTRHCPRLLHPCNPRHDDRARRCRRRRRSRTSRSARRPSGRRARGSHSWPRRCADVHAACTQLERYAWALRQ